MKPKLLFITLFLFLASALSVGQSYIVYESIDMQLHYDTNTVDYTPTVSLSGDDGGWCQLPETFPPMQGYTVPAVLVNGNSWQIGPTIPAGNFYPFQGDFTFNTVTTTQDDQTLSLAVGVTLSGYCPDLQPIDYPPDTPDNPFFMMDNVFENGILPNAIPAPCFLDNEHGSSSCGNFGPIWRTIAGAPTIVPLIQMQIPVIPFPAITRTKFDGVDPIEGLGCFMGGSVCHYGAYNYCTQTDDSLVMANYSTGGNMATTGVYDSYEFWTNWEKHRRGLIEWWEDGWTATHLCFKFTTIPMATWHCLPGKAIRDTHGVPKLNCTEVF